MGIKLPEVVWMFDSFAGLFGVQWHKVMLGVVQSNGTVIDGINIVDLNIRLVFAEM